MIIEPGSRLVRYARVGLVFGAAIAIFAYQQVNRPEPSPPPTQARQAAPTPLATGEQIIGTLMTDLFSGPDGVSYIQTVQGASLSGGVIRLRTSLQPDARQAAARLAEKGCRALATGTAPIVRVVVLDRRGAAVSRCGAVPSIPAD